MRTRIALVDFLTELGQAVAQTQIATVSEAVDTLLRKDTLDVSIPIGDEEISVDGVSLLPPGFPYLDNLIIECETEVNHILNNDKSPGVTPSSLQMSLTKGLFSRGMHVKIKAEFRSGSALEAVEILREYANKKIHSALQQKGK